MTGRGRHRQPHPSRWALTSHRSTRSGELPSAVLWAAAAALAAVGCWLLLGGGGRPRPAQQNHLDLAPVAAPARPSTPPPPDRPNSPPATSRSTSRPRAAPPPPAAANSGSPGSPAVDELAGNLSDQQMQQLLEHATGNNIAAPLAATTTTIAWQQMQADLTAGRWTQLHRQAAVARAHQPADPAPPIVDVTILWSGTSPAGDTVQRRRNVVRLSNSTGTWHLVGIT